MKGAVVSIDAMVQRGHRRDILEAKADYLLAVKDNQPTLHADIKSYFETAPSGEVERFETMGKDHGRLEQRTHTVSHTLTGTAPSGSQCRCRPGRAELLPLHQDSKHGALALTR